MEDEDVIRMQMEDTRTSLTDKLQTLEQQVANTAQAATSAVTDTVDAVKDTVQDSVAAVQETVAAVKESVQATVCAVKDTMQEGVTAVKDLFDVPGQVQRHPWFMMGGSVVLGYCLAGLLSSKRSAPAKKSDAMGPMTRGNMSQPSQPQFNGGGRDHRRQESSKKTSSGLLSALEPEITKLKGLALGALFGTVRDMIVQAVPETLGNQLKEILDSVTEKMGGQPISCSEEGASRSQESSNEGEQHEELDEAKMGGSVGTAHRQNKRTVGNGHRR